MTHDIVCGLDVASKIATVFGIIAAFISIVLVIFQMKRQNKLIKAANHLKLREMFTETNRFLVHANLRTGGDWTEGKGPSSNMDWVILEDYMGLFENCEQMLRDNVLDKIVFENTYFYRLHNLIHNEFIRDNKINSKNEDWTLLRALIGRFEPLRKFLKDI
jgi:hypothetical protein